MKKCWSCAEEVQDDAVRCRYCSADLIEGSKTRTKKPMRVGKGCLLIFLIGSGLIALLAIIGGLSHKRVPPTSTSSSDTSSNATGNITAAQFASIYPGNSYADVVSILGEPTEELSRTQMAGMTTIAYSWKNYDGSNAMIMFQNGKVVSKAQAGLR